MAPLTTDPDAMFRVGFLAKVHAINLVNPVRTRSRHFDRWGANWVSSEWSDLQVRKAWTWAPDVRSQKSKIRLTECPKMFSAFATYSAPYLADFNLFHFPFLVKCALEKKIGIANTIVRRSFVCHHTQS